MRPEPPRVPAPGSAFTDPRHLSPLSIVFHALVNPLELVPLLALAATARLWALLPAVLAVLVVARLVGWSRRVFAFDGRTLTFEEGVLWRSTRRLPVDRLQEVEVVRTLRHRLLGVSSLVVQTAAEAGKDEVKLEVLARGTADDLRDALVATRHAAGAGAGDMTGRSGDELTARSGPAPAGTVLLRLGTGRLALAGLTGVQLLSVLAVMGWLVSLGDDLPDELTPDVEARQLVLAGAIMVGLAVLALLVVWLVAAMAAAVLMYHGYTVTLDGGDLGPDADPAGARRQLRIRRGLLDQRETTIPVHRVQLVEVSHNPLRRLLGFWDLRLHSAGTPTEQGARGTIPMVRAAERDLLLRVVLPGVALDAPLVPQPPAALPRALIRGAGGALPVALAVGAVAVVVHPAVAAVAVGAGAAGAGLGYAEHRVRGHAVATGALIVRSGLWVRRLAVVPLVKVQSARTRESPFQRRRALGTLRVDLAGSARAAPVVDQRAELVHTLAEQLPR